MFLKERKGWAGAAAWTQGSQHCISAEPLNVSSCRECSMAGFGSTHVPLEPNSLSQNHRTFLASPRSLLSQNPAPTKKKVPHKHGLQRFWKTERLSRVCESKSKQPEPPSVARQCPGPWSCRACTHIDGLQTKGMEWLLFSACRATVVANHNTKALSTRCSYKL